jgi:hypothetical protein
MQTTEEERKEDGGANAIAAFAASPAVPSLSSLSLRALRTGSDDNGLDAAGASDVGHAAPPVPEAAATAPAASAASRATSFASFHPLSASSSRAAFDAAHATSEAAFWASAGGALSSPALAAAPSSSAPTSAIAGGTGVGAVIPRLLHTPELRDEREVERSRRRWALRKKAAQKKGGSSSATGGGGGVSLSASPSSFSAHSLASASSSPLSGGNGAHYHPNDGASLHPSLQHQLASSLRNHAASPNVRSASGRTTGTATSALSPALHSSRSAGALSSNLIPSPAVTPGGGVRRSTLHGGDDSDDDAALVAAAAAAAARGGVPLHHRVIDVAPDHFHVHEAVDDNDLDVFERVQMNLWHGVANMDLAQRAQAVRWIGLVHGVLALAFLAMAAASFRTFFASPAVHWTAILLGLLTIGLAKLLHSASITDNDGGVDSSDANGGTSIASSSAASSASLDTSKMLMWLLMTGAEVCVLLLLAVLSFHSDAMGRDAALRIEWESLGENVRQARYGGDFDALEAHALRDLLLLSIASLALAAAEMVLICLVLAIRTQVLAELAHNYQSLARSTQFNQRLHNRQRMARLTEQMKERRRMRKQRARHGGGGAGSNNAGAFSGLLAHQSASVRDVAADATGSGAVVGGGPTSAAVVGASSSARQGIAVAADRGRGGHGVGGGGGDLEMAVLVPRDDAERFADMASEDVEEELERAEQQREEFVAAATSAVTNAAGRRG